MMGRGNQYKSLNPGTPRGQDLQIIDNNRSASIQHDQPMALKRPSPIANPYIQMDIYNSGPSQKVIESMRSRNHSEVKREQNPI